MRVEEHDENGSVHVVDCFGEGEPIDIELDSSFLKAIAGRGDTHVVRIDSTEHRTLIASLPDAGQLKKWYMSQQGKLCKSIVQEAYLLSSDGSVEQHSGFQAADEFMCSLDE